MRTFQTKAALLWNYSPLEQGYPALVAALQKRGAPLRTVTSGSAGCTVGWLCGLPGADETATLQLVAPGSFPPALVLCGLDDQVDALLAELRAAGVRIPLKAVVTPSNSGWSFAALLENLAEEHRTIG